MLKRIRLRKHLHIRTHKITPGDVNDRWRVLLARFQLSSDFQQLELFKLTEARLGAHACNLHHLYMHTTCVYFHLLYFHLLYCTLQYYAVFYVILSYFTLLYFTLLA